MNQNGIAVFWFRRDLRIEDNRGLYETLSRHTSVLPVFIFDTTILDQSEKNDPRVSFIYETLGAMNELLLKKYKSGISLHYGKPVDVFKKISNELDIKHVYANHDYEPGAIQRDLEIKNYLSEKGIDFRTYKDQVIFEKNQILKNDGSPYVVYTPYMKKWKEVFNEKTDIPGHIIEPLGKHFYHGPFQHHTLEKMGFIKSRIKVLPYNTSSVLISDYHKTRDFPSEKGTSLLGPHLRFGTISIRRIIEKALTANDKTFLNELIWREFFMQILWHFPHIVHKSFKPKYDRIAWRNNKDEFRAWCAGKTGYPIVDAGMRQLNKTGYMHNRVRMITASFLCKHLLIDWRWGEAYFAQKLLDYEMASNIGNWQWVAGCGVDAAPYFRIFNPASQTKKFDKDLTYVNTWVKDLNELNYPQPIIDHKEARDRCLNTYRKVLN